MKKFVYACSGLFVICYIAWIHIYVTVIVIIIIIIIFLIWNEVYFKKSIQLVYDIYVYIYLKALIIFIYIRRIYIIFSFLYIYLFNLIYIGYVFFISIFNIYLPDMHRYIYNWIKWTKMSKFKTDIKIYMTVLFIEKI